MTESYSYPQIAYNTVLKEIQHRFGIDNHDLPPAQWRAWRKRIKELFEECFTVNEIIFSLDEACEKKHWPSNVAFWHRVRDVCRKNKLQSQTVRIDRGAESLGGILDRVMKSGCSPSSVDATSRTLPLNGRF